MRVHAKLVAMAGLLAAMAAPLPASAQTRWDESDGATTSREFKSSYRRSRSNLGGYDAESETRATRKARGSKSARRSRQVRYVETEDGYEARPRRSSRRSAQRMRYVETEDGYEARPYRNSRRSANSRRRVQEVSYIGSDDSYEAQPRRRSRRGTRVASLGSDYAGGGGGSHGIASYYWQPQRVASGGWFNPNAMTAAHKTLPFGTRVRVTHLGNGRSVTVTINDRGPYIAGRIIDLSKAAAGVIGMQGQGIARIRMDVLGR